MYDLFFKLCDLFLNCTIYFRHYNEPMKWPVTCITAKCKWWTQMNMSRHRSLRRTEVKRRQARFRLGWVTTYTLYIYYVLLFFIPSFFFFYYIYASWWSLCRFHTQIFIHFRPWFNYRASVKHLYMYTRTCVIFARGRVTWSLSGSRLFELCYFRYNQVLKS